MFSANLPVVLILLSAFPVLFFQQIFENSRSTCEYFNLNVSEKEDQKLQIADTPWEITRSVRNSAIKIHLSPCGDPLPPTMGCGPGAAVCILDTKNPRKSVLNAGRYFNYTVDEESGAPVLQSVDGQSCSPYENYTVIVQFECDSNVKSSPTYLYKDECELRIRMMKPSCTPLCTSRVEGNLIDLRPLQAVGSITVEEPNTRRSFVVNFCKAAKECGSSVDVSICETTGGSIVETANPRWQRITYDSNTNELVVKSHFGNNKRNRKNTEIHIKCNWKIQGVIANMKYIVPVLQGRNYRFEGESSLACIKLPMNCVIKHRYEQFILYNLTSLNKQNGGWRVGNVNFGSIYINICGPLTMSQPNSNCSDQYSQVCYLNGTRQFVNLGSIPVEFHVTTDDTIKGKFVDGTTCAKNKSLTYSTEIEFFCSRTEKGPNLEAVNDCTYQIKWETPTACSKHFAVSDECHLSDITGYINLSSLHKPSDRVHTFTQTSHLRYNLCGPLNKPCDGNKNAGMCYVKDGREYVVGLYSKILTRDTGLLSLNLEGDQCDTRSKRTTKIYFRCNHSAPLDGNVKVNIVKDNCLFEMKIDTPLACASPSSTSCTVYNNNSVYYLTPLLRNDSNYVVRDSNSSVAYIINVCRSVINSGDTLCPPGAGACMNNLTELHMEHKYVSMGNVNERSTPVIENGDLVIRYTVGSYCADAETLKRSTIIRFRCSDREGNPRLLKKDSCSHEFLWRTRSACAKQILSLKTRSTNSACKYTDPHTGKLIDFSNINKILYITGNKNIYKFTLCESNYTRCSLNDTDCEIFESLVQILSNKTDLYLKYPLKNHCYSDGQANKLHIHLKCDPVQENQRFSVTGISNCTFHVNLLTNLACSSKESTLTVATKLHLDDEVTKEDNFQNDRMAHNQDSSHTAKPSISLHDKTTLYDSAVVMKTSSEINSGTTEKKFLLHPAKASKKSSCIIESNETNSHLDLKSIKSIDVSSSTGVNYAVTLSQPSSVCGGYICKNDFQVVPESDKCPAIKFNHTYSMVKLSYNSYQVCDSGHYRPELWLKCNSTAELPSVFKEEKCSVVIIYPLNDVCSLLKKVEVYTSNAGIAIGAVVGLLAVAVSTIGGFVIARKRHVTPCSRTCYQQIPEDKENVRVYYKNTTL